jgi:hypothetical protein
MKKFHFNFWQGHSCTADEEGCEFGNAEEAYLGAFTAAQDMWRELLIRRQDPTLCAFEVTDEEGHELFVLPFGEVLDVCRGRSTVPPIHQPNKAIEYAMESRRLALQTSSDVQRTVRDARATLSETWALLAEVDNVLTGGAVLQEGISRVHPDRG